LGRSGVARERVIACESLPREVVLVLTAGILLAAALGMGLSLMLVAMLQHVFRSPPDQLVMLGRAGGAGLAPRLPLASLLREP